MTRFISPRDMRFFYNINNEFINDILETEVQIFKVVINESNPDDIYAESTSEKYFEGVRINCLIKRDNPSANNDIRGTIVAQDIEIAINREMARQKNIYPEIGDIIEWNSYFFEANNVIENQRIGGRNDADYNWSFVISAHLTNAGNMNIIPRNQ